jgi:hypothetical protein
MYGMLDRNSRNRGHNPSAHLERTWSATAAHLLRNSSTPGAQLQRNYSTTAAPRRAQHHLFFIIYWIRQASVGSFPNPAPRRMPFPVCPYDRHLCAVQASIVRSACVRPSARAQRNSDYSRTILGLFSDYSRNIPDYSRITLVLPRQRGLDQCCEFETMHVTVIFSRPADHEVDMLALADRDGRTRNNMLQMMEMVQKVCIIEFDFVNMASSLRNRRPRHTSKTVIVPVSAFFRQSGTALELMHVTLWMSYRFRKSRSGCYPRGTLFLLHRQEGLLTILGFPPSLY